MVLPARAEARPTPPARHGPRRRRVVRSARVAGGLLRGQANWCARLAAFFL
jgi:hypothetical protein